MSKADKDKWNSRYREGAYSQRTHPSALLQEWLPRLDIVLGEPQAVDIGCGAGRNCLYLARNGWSVAALDISQVALDRLADSAAEENLPIVCTQADLETSSALPGPLRLRNAYDLGVMIRYTNLSLIGDIEPALKVRGYLIVELHLQSQADVVGPGNPKFRVAPGELRQAADGLEIVEYREGLVTEPDGRIAALAQLVARRHER